MIKIIDLEPKFDVPPPPSRAAAGDKAAKEPRVTLADKLRELPLNAYYDLDGKKKTSVDSSIFAAKKRGKLSGKFTTREVVEDGFTGVRVWRIEAGDNIHQLQAAE